ncbi:MAG: pyridoxal-dependent decarboxylase [Armatimonadetes bacterium]|nr:pyridoxal-dependent decarboxylase [Armatimonadota bacterium]
MAGFAPFDPDTFRAQGHRLVDRLADYLAQAVSGDPELPVLPHADPNQLLAQWSCDFEQPISFEALTERVLAGSNHLHHPRYMGHQVTAPLPLGALCELIDGLLNNANAVYEMGPVVTAIERNLSRWLGARLGWDARCDGFFTSGGSLGNLTALLAARQVQAGFDVFTDGLLGGEPLAVLVSESAHYSVTRSLQIMGLGQPGVIKVPVDERYRLRPEALPAALAQARAAGRRPIAVAASACCTATGTFDPLGPIADFCAEHGLWLHVDGAHGASAALSERYRELLAGIERADSVLWDAHKMLLTPALCTAVLFRNGDHSFAAFTQQASYLLHQQNPRDEWYNLCGRTVECTKTMTALRLYAALAVLGPRVLGDYVTDRFDLGRRFGQMLDEADDFEMPVAPECNIVCFAYSPPGAAAMPGLQAAIRQRLLADERFHIVQTQLGGRVWLRVTIINPLTTEEDLVALMAATRAAGQELLG